MENSFNSFSPEDGGPTLWEDPFSALDRDGTPRRSKAGSDTDSAWMDNIANSLLEPSDELFMDSEGVIHRGGDTLNGSGNATKISEGTFASPVQYPEQWYHKNPSLFRAEVSCMQIRHPKARYGFMPQSGDMYWVLELKIGQGIDPWQFMLRYMWDHPHNRDYGGSIRVILLKHPSVEDLMERASRAGRRGVPHILTGENRDGKRYYYLCTRTKQDVEDGLETITSAVQVAAWAGDWALHFELGMRDKRVWNQWCDDGHFSDWIIP